MTRSTLRDNGLKIVAVGYTVYLGSEYESEQMREAAQACMQAHRNGLLAVLWIYPRGAAVPKEQDPHLIAGATGLGATLGADFCKVNYPKPEDGRTPAEAFKEAVQAAGRTRVITAGGGSTDVRKFLQTLHDQIFISGAYGSATGRNIHQKPLTEAVRMTDAISAITYGGMSVDDAMSVYEGRTEFPSRTNGAPSTTHRAGPRIDYVGAHVISHAPRDIASLAHRDLIRHGSQ